MEKVEINPFKKKAILDALKKEQTPESILKNVAEDFAVKLASGVREGLDVETTFIMCKDFFKTYGKAMLDFGEKVELHMFPPGTFTRPPKPKDDDVRTPV